MSPKPVEKPKEGNTLDSFLEPESSPLTIVDRSTLELYGVCPAQARFKECGMFPAASKIAAVGVAGHEAFSGAVTEYLMSDGQLQVGELAGALTGLLYAARPDVQDAVIAATRSSVYGWCRFLAGGSIHPKSILRYDGGRGPRSGQLAFDWPDLGIRITSEIDFLHAITKEVLGEIDFKMGHKQYTLEDVESSFQFSLHAFLVFQNYEKVECLRVRIWNSRLNKPTHPVEFERRDLPALERMIRSTAEAWSKYRNVEPSKAPAWPFIEKCSICDAAYCCPGTNFDIQDFAKDRASAIDELAALEARADAIRALAAAHVDKTGEEIITPAGNAFGVRKPKKQQKPQKALYSVKSERD